MKHYHKLVRDRIPDILKAKGLRPETHRVEGDALIEALKQKLVEEAQEASATDDLLEEIADVYEVLCALLTLLNIAWADVESAAKRKREQRGGFETGIVLDTVG